MRGARELLQLKKTGSSKPASCKSSGVNFRVSTMTVSTSSGGSRRWPASPSRCGWPCTGARRPRAGRRAGRGGRRGRHLQEAGRRPPRQAHRGRAAGHPLRAPQRPDRARRRPDELVFPGPGGSNGIPRGARTPLSTHNLRHTLTYAAPTTCATPSRPGWKTPASPRG
jgi:hypothetical protein